MIIQQITLHAEQLFTFSTAHVMSYLQIKPNTNNIRNMSKSFFKNVNRSKKTTRKSLPLLPAVLPWNKLYTCLCITLSRSKISSKVKPTDELVRRSATARFLFQSYVIKTNMFTATRLSVHPLEEVHYLTVVINKLRARQYSLEIDTTSIMCTLNCFIR